MNEEDKDITRGELEGFVRSRVWQAIVAYSISRTRTLMENNNHIDPFKEPSTICRNQGMIAGIEELIDLPAIFAEEIEYNKKQEEMKEDAD